MQKKMNVETVGTVHTCLYKISVQEERKVENKRVIKIDEAKTYEQVVGY